MLVEVLKPFFFQYLLKNYSSKLEKNKLKIFPVNIYIHDEVEILSYLILQVTHL